MKTEQAQKLLSLSSIFIIINIIIFAGMAIGAAIFVPSMADFLATVADPTAQVFLDAVALYPELLYLIPIGIGILAGVQVIYLAIILYWRSNPLKHTTGLTIVGILNLLVGFNLSGLLILLAGVLVEEA